MALTKEQAVAIALARSRAKIDPRTEYTNGMSFEPEGGQTSPIPFDVPDFTVQERSLETGQLEQRVPGFLERAQRGGEAERSLISQIGAGLAMPGISGANIALGPVRSPLLSKAPGFVKGPIEAIPQIATVSGLGGASQIDPSKGLTDNLSSFADIASEEAAGAMIGGQLSSTAEKMFPGLAGRAKELVEYAREKGVKIDPRAIDKKRTSVMSHLSEQGALGGFIRRQSGKQINEFMEQEFKRVSPLTQSIEQTAQETASTLNSVLTAADEGKSLGYGAIKELVIPDDFRVQWGNTREGIRVVMDDMARRGKTETKLYKEMEKVISGPEKTYNDLDKFEKKLTKMARDPDLSPDVKNLQPYLDLDFEEIGSKRPKVKRDFLLKNGLSEESLSIIGTKESYSLDELRGISAQEFKELKRVSNLIKPPGSKRGFNEILSEKGYVKSLFNPNQKELLDYIQSVSPGAYKNIRDARLSMVFREMTEGSNFNASKLTDYLRQNNKFLKESYGSRHYEALENFARYLEDNQSLIRSAEAANQQLGQAGMEFGAATILGAHSQGNILLKLMGAEAAGGTISHLLSKPNSWLFKLMTGKTPQTIKRALDEAGRGFGRSIDLDEKIGESARNRINNIFQVGPQGAFQ